MAYSNNNKRIHDTPVWLPTAQFRSTTNALASITTAKSSNDRYIYYLQGSLFFKYDTQKDVHIKLASPNISAVIGSSIKFSSDEGYRGLCLAATSNSITIPGLYSDLFIGQTIRITAGTGFGQERIITSLNDSIIWDSGVATGANISVIVDSTKKWTINQYLGYQVRITYGAGVSQVRKVLYNDTNTLYFFDINQQQLEPWNNTAFSTIFPYATPSSTAGSQTNYVIESAVANVSSPWSITPDLSSQFVIKTGGVFMISSLATAPWSSFQFYDVISDVWSTKTALGGNLLGALGTDFAIEIITEETPFLSGTASSGTSRTLVDNTKSMLVDRFCNYSIKVISGPGTGEENRIVANGLNYFEIEKPWIIQPTSLTVYEIHCGIGKIYLTGNGASSIYQYSIEYDAWMTGQSIDYGQTRNASVKFNGQEAYGINSAVRNANGITVLNTIPTTKGSGYLVGDLFNITTGGTAAKGRVDSISAGGLVETVSLFSTGLNYTTGPSKATTVISGVGNNGLTVNITTVGVVGRITVLTNTNLNKGNAITISGATDAAWNTTSTIIACDSLTAFDIITTATANLVASFSQSSTLIVDSTKVWVVDEHIGKIVKLDTAGPSSTSQFRRIISNTATAITVTSISTGINGTSRYVIMNPEAFGKDRQYNYAAETNDGRATSGTSTTLTDSTKTWQVNQWLNARVRILAGTGVGREVLITSNDVNTLSMSTLGFIPDATTKYIIMDTFGVATAGTTTTLTDTTKTWTINKWAGKRLVYNSGSGQRIETTIISNTVNTLTYNTTTTPDTTTCYTILGLSTRSTGVGLRWIFGNTDTDLKGTFLICPRGGNTSTIDKYNITTDRWDFGFFYNPSSEVLNTGSYYSYDGINNFYFTIGVVNDFIYIFSLNINTMMMDGAFQTTVLQGTAHTGNLMDIVSSPDGGKFLFLGVCTSRLMYKTLLY
jgi:hypothetical protein